MTSFRWIWGCCCPKVTKFSQIWRLWARFEVQSRQIWLDLVTLGSVWGPKVIKSSQKWRLGPDLRSKSSFLTGFDYFGASNWPQSSQSQSEMTTWTSNLVWSRHFWLDLTTLGPVWGPKVVKSGQKWRLWGQIWGPSRHFWLDLTTLDLKSGLKSSFLTGFDDFGPDLRSKVVRFGQIWRLGTSNLVQVVKSGRSAAFKREEAKKSTLSCFSQGGIREKQLEVDFLELLSLYALLKRHFCDFHENDVLAGRATRGGPELQKSPFLVIFATPDLRPQIWPQSRHFWPDLMTWGQIWGLRSISPDLDLNSVRNGWI